MDNLKVLKAKLNAQGYRFTTQRQLIFQLFQTLPTGNHLSAESLHFLLIERGEVMSLSTVYRNLKIMARMGMIREIELAQPQKHYELNTIFTRHHHHLICVQCHQIIKFENNSILKQALKQAQKSGMQLIDCKLTLHTICLEALQMAWPTTPNNWVCPRFMTVDKAETVDYQQLDLKTDIKEQPVRRIDLKGGYIVVSTPKDEIEKYQKKAKQIPGWRFSRADKTLYFPLEKASEVINLFPGYEIDARILDN